MSPAHARAARILTRSLPTLAAGTPFYVAPELFDSSKLAPASDVFSFGVIMWEIFMGCPPFVVGRAGPEKHPDLPGFPPHSPFNYAVLALACMTPVPEDRPPFSQIVEVLTSLDVELANGEYRDLSGHVRVRLQHPHVMFRAASPSAHVRCMQAIAF